jgi:hypothetical protein
MTWRALFSHAGGDFFKHFGRGEGKGKGTGEEGDEGMEREGTERDGGGGLKLVSGLRQLWTYAMYEMWMASKRCNTRSGITSIHNESPSSPCWSVEVEVECSSALFQPFLTSYTFAQSTTALQMILSTHLHSSLNW